MIRYYYAIVTKLYEYFYGSNILNTSGLGRIYMFHDVGDCDTDPKSFYTNIHGFNLFIDYELKHRTPVPIEDIVEKDSNSHFAITFDDVFESAYVNAIPELIKRNIPFTIFVSTELLDKEGYLSKTQLLELAKEPLCTIGAHSVSHSRLRTDPNSYNNILLSKIELEHLTSRNIDLFAFPYGSIYACSYKNVVEVKKAGFKYAFSTIKGYTTKSALKHNFFLPRINGDHIVRKIERGEFI